VVVSPPVADEGFEMESRRPPGRAQNVAAPLRRALVAAGFEDVLTTPLDSATVLRSLNSGRLTTRQLDALRFTTGQILEAAKKGDPAYQTEGTPSYAALAQSRQIAVASAARIGLTLGYRAVVVLAVAPDNRAARPAALYSVMLVDAANGTGQALTLRQEGAQQIEIDQAAAAEAAQGIAAVVHGWKPFSATDRAAAVQKYLEAARASIENSDLATAQDQLNLVVSFDPSNSEAYILMGDVLQSTDPVAAARAYQRAAEINTKSGEVWAKIAIVHTLSTPPDWIRSLQSANRAQQLGYDSANLRTAMAASEFGRAELFRRSGRIEQAEDAELLARRHLERARELAPDSPEVSASVSRLMAKYLLDQKRYKEAVASLDLLAIQYPDDLQTQTMYARALEGYGRRDEDTFMAWARVWKLSGESEVPLDAARYAVIADGFDQRLVSLGKNVFQMTYGVSTGAILRESAILQTARAKEEFQTAVAALRLMKPPPGRTSSDAHTARLFAADLMQLALEHYSVYLETSNDINRVRAVENHKQAIESLNTARGSTAAM
jgi:tetratricopeptide (TPR) repeat protein